tara:strand:- start:382 stop:627 length:246 start_codon:yes stop_codon:yes gene_type:complete
MTKKQEETFTIRLTETRVTTKIITLKKEEDVPDLAAAERYVSKAIEEGAVSFEEINNRETIIDECELTYNGKQDWELEVED